MKCSGARPRLVVSACLCGVPCRYDGKSCLAPELAAWRESGAALAVCPESEGGLPVPRPPCELVKGRALTRNGVDCTAAFLAGARRVLDMALEYGAALAVLKDKSPSCGSNYIYDGTFSGRLISGRGLTAALMLRHGLAVASEENFRDVIEYLAGSN